MAAVTGTATRPVLLATVATAACAGWLTARLSTSIREERLRYDATHDRLTGLYNRHGWATEAERAARRALRNGDTVSVGIIDIDGLKAVNDTFGHAAGDALIRVAGHRVAACALEAVAARIGGDEFAILVTAKPNTPDGWSCALAGILRRGVCGSVGLPTVCTSVTLSVSIGIAAYDRDLTTSLARADAEMYRVKHSAAVGVYDDKLMSGAVLGG